MAEILKTLAFVLLAVVAPWGLCVVLAFAFFKFEEWRQTRE